jgi:hypothetical protein
LERYRSVDVENGLAWAIRTSVALVMAKRKAGVKLVVWLLTTKSQESTQPRCVQVEWDTPLESSWRKLQLCLKARPNPRSEQRVMVPQSCESLNLGSFGTLPWESGDKNPFGCGCRAEMQKILCGGRWWLPPSPGRGESCESRVARGLS